MPHASNPLDIYYSNGFTLAVQMYIWDGAKPILWDGSVTFSGSLPSTVAGNKTNNAAAPGSNNLGALVAIANASAPSYSEGNEVLLSTDLSGSLRVSATIDTSAIATSANQTNGNQKTKIVDGSGNVIGSTSNALDINIKSGNPTSITANAGTNLNTSALALESGGNLALIAGGGTPYSYISAGSSNQDSQIVKNSAARLQFISVFSTVTSARFVKLYNKATGPTSSDTPVHRIAIPANTTGAGSNLPIPKDLLFGTGLAFRITTGAADNDTGAASANDVFVNFGYT